MYDLKSQEKFVFMNHVFFLQFTLVEKQEEEFS